MIKKSVSASLAMFGIAFAPSAWSGSAATDEVCRALTPADYPAKKTQISTHTDYTRGHYPERITEFMQNPLGCGEIVMLGDSLTERYDWSGSLSVLQKVQNRGISGDTSDGVLARLEEIVASRPHSVFLMIGTNDLWTNNSPKKTSKNIEKIILALRASNPQLPIFVETVFPLRSEPARNEKVKSINIQLADVARVNGVTLIDTYDAMVDENGLLRSQYTDDGVHLTPAGYKVWVSLLNRRIRQAQLLSLSTEAP